MNRYQSDILPTDASQLSRREETDLRLALERLDAPRPDVDEAWTEVNRRIEAELLADCKIPADADDTAYTVSLKVGSRQSRWLMAGLLAAACLAGLVFMIRPGKKAEQTDAPTVATVKKPTADRPAVATPTATAETKKAAESVASAIDAPQTHQLALSTNRGEQRHATLPDGTKVWLNACTSLSYTDDGQHRHVDMEGEAYFDVRHEADRPFTVRTPYMTTTDLGTSFNVKAYSSREASVVLVSGSVAVDNGATKLTLAAPGQEAIVSGANLSLTQTDLYPVSQWREGWFYYHNTPMVQIMQELSRWYGVNVVFENSTVAARRLHFVAPRTESLDSLAEKLQRMDGIELQVNGKKIVVR